MIVDRRVEPLKCGYQDENWNARIWESDNEGKSAGGEFGTGMTSSSSSREA